MMNLGEEAVVVEEASIAVGVSRADTQENIWSASLAPLSGTIPGKKGALRTRLLWDQRDRSGEPVPPGEYVVYLDLPATVKKGPVRQSVRDQSLRD